VIGFKTKQLMLEERYEKSINLSSTLGKYN